MPAAKAETTPTPPPSQLKVTTSFQTSPNMRRRLEEVASREGVSMVLVIVRALTEHFDKVDRRAWGVLDPDEHYDPHRRYTFGSDQKGHSSEIRVQIPKPLRGEIQSLIESGLIPEYHTAQHVARDALYHKVKQLSIELENGTLEAAVDLAILISEEEQIRAQELEAKSYLSLVRDNLHTYLTQAHETGDYTRVREYISERSARADQVPEAYRAEFETTLKEYRKLVRKASND